MFGSVPLDAVFYLGISLFLGCYKQNDVFDDSSYGTLYCTSLYNFYKNGVDSQTDVVYVYIHGNNKAKFGTLQENTFKNYNIVSVISIGSAINGITPGAFNGIQHVEELHLEDNNLPIIKGKSIQFIINIFLQSLLCFFETVTLRSIA